MKKFVAVLSAAAMMTSEIFIRYSPNVFENLRPTAQPYPLPLPYPICRTFATGLDFFPAAFII